MHVLKELKFLYFLIYIEYILYEFFSLETMYKLDNDLQDITKNKATTPIINTYDEKMNIFQNSPNKQKIQIKALKSPGPHNITHFCF